MLQIIWSMNARAHTHVELCHPKAPKEQWGCPKKPPLIIISERKPPFRPSDPHKLCSVIIFSAPWKLSFFLSYQCERGEQSRHLLVTWHDLSLQAGLPPPPVCRGGPDPLSASIHPCAYVRFSAQTNDAKEGLPGGEIVSMPQQMQ